MTALGLAEAPLTAPSEDRLGVDPSAQRLAEFLQKTALPLTVGIWGPWGSGKTSFANLFVYHLREFTSWNELRYLSFSAWPYVTPDAIWRALLQQIAAAILQPPSTDTEAQDRRGWRESLCRPFLSGEDADSPQETYNRLIRRFDRAANLANRTRADESAATMSAVADAILDTAAAITPVVTPLRSLFGRADESASRASPQVIHSVEEMRHDLRELFSRAPQTRLVVLVDDLDRCLPQVALDVLETIKIFFFESAGVKAPCLFLAAADERLVARGLQARLERSNDHGDENESREYLEKIVQFGIDLPQVESDGAHSLIAAYRPEWALTSDLVLMALENHPRRIKQQCALMSYQFGTRREDSTTQELRRVLDQLTRRYERERERALKDAPELRPVSSASRVILCDLACARPGVDGLPDVTDRPFGHIARTVAEQPATTPEQINIAYAQRLVLLKWYVPAVAQLASDLATQRPAAYETVVCRLDDSLDAQDTALGPTLSASDSLMKELVDEWKRATEAPSARIALTQAPRLSEIPREYLTLVPVIRPAVELRESYIGDLLAASDVAARLTFAPDIMTAVECRLHLARDVLARRKFAKAGLLHSRWLRLAERVRAPGGRRRLHDLERSVRAPDEDIKLSPGFEQARTDERLRAFLRMPPFFSDIYPTDVSYKGQPTGPTDPGGTEIVDRDEQVGEVGYSDVYLELAASGGSHSAVDTNIEFIGADGMRVSSVTVEIPRAALRQKAEELAASYLHISTAGLTRDAAPPRNGGARFPPPDQLLADLGAALWSTTFGAAEEAASALRTALEGDKRVRLRISATGGGLDELPWECMRIPSHRVFAGQTRKISVVRTVPDIVRLAQYRVGQPLRVLAVAPDMERYTLPGAQQELALMEQTLAIGQGRVELVRLSGAVATQARIRAELRTFRPHVFHFIGHGTVEQDRGYLIFVGEDGQPHPLDAVQIGTMLQDEGICLAVLNGCATAGGSFDLGGGVGQVLVHQGVPAVIATTRVILDVQAVRFTQEFYSAMMIGYAAEPALVEARKDLALRNLDWSAYALYATDSFPLEDLRVSMTRSAA